MPLADLLAATFSDAPPAAVREGDVIYLPATVLREPLVVQVVLVEGGKALLAPSGQPNPGVWVPLPSVPLFAEEMRGRITVPPGAADPAVAALSRGEGSFLGKGDDGILFRVGNEVVKSSTTVPLRPFQYDHRSPGEAAAMLSAQHGRSEKLRALGIPVVPGRGLEHGGRFFIVYPWLDMPPTLSPAQLALCRDAVLAMHRAGWAMRDRPQLGIDPRDGKPYLFDVGKATDDASDGDRENDLRNLARLYESNGQEPPLGVEFGAASLWVAGFAVAHFPAGTEGGRGGQFMPADDAGGGAGNGKTFDLDVPDKAMQLAALAFGKDFRPEHLAALAGGRPGDRVRVKVASEGALEVRVENDRYRADRTVRLGRPPTMSNDHFEVKPGHQGAGEGAEVFLSQVVSGLRWGVSRIRAFAGGHGDGTLAKKSPGEYTGYYTWPRLGYNAEIEPSTLKGMPSQYHDCRTLHELFSRPGGPEAWYKFGTATTMQFDLKPGSPCVAILRAYARAKGISTEHLAALADPALDPAARVQPGPRFEAMKQEGWFKRLVGSLTGARRAFSAFSGSPSPVKLPGDDQVLSQEDEDILHAIWLQVQEHGFDALEDHPPAHFAQEHFPAGTEGGRGGQFMPADDAGGGGSPPVTSTHTEALGKLDEWTRGFPANQSRAYHAAMASVFQGMPERSLRAFMSNAEAGVKFVASLDEVKNSYVNSVGVKASTLGPSDYICGFWRQPPGGGPSYVCADGPLPRAVWQGRLGPGESPEEFSMRHIYAHEVAHGIDKDYRYSKTLSWQVAWQQEVMGDHFPLSKQAKLSPQEGWAEFGRLLFTDHARAARDFPKCYAFWKRKKLL